MRRTAIAATLALTLTFSATTAIAGSRVNERTDGFTANTWWTQVDGPPAAKASTQPFGNVHVGWLDAYETSRGKADAFASIDDFRCPTGVLPDHGGHGEKADENGCQYLGSRFGDGYGLAFTIDRKLGSARLRGALELFADGHGGDGTVVGRPTADITWNASGPTYRSVSTYRDQFGGTSYSERYRSQNRNASMGGTLGPMGFDPDLSGGTISSYRSMYQQRSR